MLTSMGALHHVRPWFLNSPTSSLFLASTLMTGCPRRTNDFLSRLISLNCRWRSGEDFCASRFRLNRSRYFPLRSILHTLVWLTRIARDTARVDLRTHFTEDIGSPAVVSSSTLASRVVSPGLFFPAA